MSARSAYINLTSSIKKARYLRGVSELLAWDQQTMMPPKSAAVRGEQTAVVSGILHGMETDSKIDEYVSE
jgi:carboxypeptidase Taq